MRALASSIAAGYRSALPHSVRTVLYFGRRGLKTLVTRGYGPEFLVSWLAVRVAAGFESSAVVANGMKLNINLRDFGVAHVLYLEGLFEPDETSFVRSRITPGMVVVDIGANLGYFTTLFSRLAGPGGRVFAFEPDPMNYSLLEKNVQQNACANVSLFPVAIGERQGTAELHGFDDNFGNRAIHSAGDTVYSAPIQVEPLDDVLRDRGIASVDFLKMDIQGYEPIALRGMMKTLANSKNLTVLSEFFPWGMRQSGSSVDDFLHPFRDLGYSAFLLERGGAINPVEFASLADLVDADNHASYANLVLRRGTH